MSRTTITIIILSLILLSITTIFVFNDQYKTTSNSSSITVDSSRKKLRFDTLELAKTPKEQEQGLMFRTNLCESCGMIFVFEVEKPLSFWMKNTYIPLDMIFIDKNGKIVTIYQNTTPKQTSLLYNSELPAKYVIETNAFYTQKIELKKGDLIDIDKLIESSVPFIYLDK